MSVLGWPLDSGGISPGAPSQWSSALAFAQCGANSFAVPTIQSVGSVQEAAIFLVKTKSSILTLGPFAGSRLNPTSAISSVFPPNKVVLEAAAIKHCRELSPVNGRPVSHLSFLVDHIFPHSGSDALENCFCGPGRNYSLKESRE